MVTDPDNRREQQKLETKVVEVSSSENSIRLRLRSAIPTSSIKAIQNLKTYLSERQTPWVCPPRLRELPHRHLHHLLRHTNAQFSRFRSQPVSLNLSARSSESFQQDADSMSQVGERNLTHLWVTKLAEACEGRSSLQEAAAGAFLGGRTSRKRRGGSLHQVIPELYQLSDETLLPPPTFTQIQPMWIESCYSYPGVL